MSRAIDVVVVGCGVIGASVAYYLSRTGASVLVIERGDLASGTSSACDGNVLLVDKKPGFDSLMTYESQRLYDSLEQELEHDFCYRRFGSTLAVEDEEQQQVARDWARTQQQAGLPLRYLEARKVHGDEPMLARDIIGLLECDSDSSLDPMRLVFGLGLGARRYGARFMRFCEVKSVLTDSRRRVKGVDTTEGAVACGSVVLAAGVWTAAVAERIGVHLPIIPRQGQIVVAERCTQPGRRKIMEFGYLMTKFGGAHSRRVEPEMDKHGVAFVYEPTADGNFLLGSSRQFCGFDTRVDPDVVKLIARRAMRFYPCIADLHVIRTYVGLRPYTEDHLPIVSSVKEVPGLYIAAGHEGDGIGLSPITGLLISQMITSQTPRVPIEPLSIERFRPKSTSAV